MPNTIDATGLTVKTLAEIVADLTVGFQNIYGADINVASNSPDGQMINIFATAAEDNLELLETVYNMFSLTNAFGVQVDNLVAVNGIQRQAGTQTIAQVLVTVSQALTLPGLDVLVGNPNATVFTVSDDSGNLFQLQTSHVFGGSGSATLAFVAVQIGEVLTTPNTINVITTPLLGVTSVNNPSTGSDVIGINEETDVQLKVRQAKSFYIAATGPADALRAQLLNTPGVADAYVVENDSGSPAGGVNGHSIWVIVRGGAPVDIAHVIYAKKTLGCGQTGAQTFTITRPQGNTFTAQWDNAIAQNLYIRFTIAPINGVDTFNDAELKQSLVDTLFYHLGQSASIGDVIRAMLAIAPNGVLSTVNVSNDGSSWVDVLAPTDAQHYFVLSTARITITP